MKSTQKITQKFNNNPTLFNVLTSLLLHGVTIISSFIIPRLILSYFGSEVNGLVSSLTQLLNYVTLIEGGVGNVIMAALYKPLHDHDDAKVSSIVKTANSFYHKILACFLIYTVGVAIIYPLVFHTGFSFAYVCSLTLILSLSLSIQYGFSLTLRNLLSADKKVYIVSLTQSGIAIAGIILSVLAVKVFPSIHLLKLIPGLLFIIQPVVYRHYTKKLYQISPAATEDSSLLRSRWDGLAVNIAYFVHSNTDVVILTLFRNLATVSIYSVYALVITGLRNVLNAINSGISPTMGHLYVSDDEKSLNQKFDAYELFNFFSVFFIFTVAALLVSQFVMLYTSGISDADYFQPLFGILLAASEAMYLIKNPHVNLAYSAGKFKEVKLSCYLEAGINIVVSLLLVNRFGLVGVAIGTLIAMTYRAIYHVFFTKKLIGRPVSKFFNKFLIFALADLIGILICVFLIPPVELTIVSWLFHAVVYSFIFLAIFTLVSIIFYRADFQFFFDHYIKKFLRRKNA